MVRKGVTFRYMITETTPNTWSSVDTENFSGHAVSPWSTLILLELEAGSTNKYSPSIQDLRNLLKIA